MKQMCEYTEKEIVAGLKVISTTCTSHFYRNEAIQLLNKGLTSESDFNKGRDNIANVINLNMNN